MFKKILVIALTALFVVNSSSVNFASWEWDTTQPVFNSLSINNNDSSTNSQIILLSFNAFDNVWITEIDLKNSTDAWCSTTSNYVEWLRYKNTMTWSLTPWNWQKFVCARIRDATWNQTNWLSDWITLVSSFFLSRPSPNSFFHNAWNLTVSLNWWWFFNWATYGYKVIWDYADWQTEITWSLSFVWQSRLNANLNIWAIDTALWWEDTWYPKFFNLLVEDNNWQKSETKWNSFTIYKDPTWSVWADRLKFQESLSVFKTLMDWWLLYEVPYVEWCRNQQITYIAKTSFDWSCFQIGWVLRWASWLTARVFWNCRVPDWWVWPIWIRDWETDLWLIRNYLYDPVACQ